MFKIWKWINPANLVKTKKSCLYTVRSVELVKNSLFFLMLTIGFWNYTLCPIFLRIPCRSVQFCVFQHHKTHNTCCSELTGIPDTCVFQTPHFTKHFRCIFTFLLADAQNCLCIPDLWKPFNRKIFSATCKFFFWILTFWFKFTIFECFDKSRRSKCWSTFVWRSEWGNHTHEIPKYYEFTSKFIFCTFLFIYSTENIGWSSLLVKSRFLKVYFTLNCISSQILTVQSSPEYSSLQVQTYPS